MAFGADALLVLGAVDLDEDLVDDALLARLDTFDRRSQLVDDGLDGLEDALAAVAALVAVAELVRLERTGGCTGRDGRPLHDAVVEEDLHLDGRVSARVENLACATASISATDVLLAQGENVVWSVVDPRPV